MHLNYIIMFALKCQGFKGVQGINYLKDLFKNADRVLLALPALFAVISIVMIESTIYKGSFELSRDVVIQLVAYLIGMAAVFVTLMFDYTQYAGITRILYIVSILCMLLVYTPLGMEQYGSRAWLDFGFVTMQPCEIVKITFSLIYAKYLTDHSDELLYFKGLVKAVLYGAPLILIILVEDMGNALVVSFMMIVMIYAAGVNRRIYWGCAAGVCACLPVAYFFMQDHQRARIDAFLHPNDLSINANYQVWHSKISIGSGGFFGKGLFKGEQKSLDFLPVAKSDFIFAVICEELGFIGGGFVIALYTLFIYRIVRIAERTKDTYGYLVVIGLGAMFFFQIFENIGMTIGIMPVTGITLPFISSGGTSVIMNLIALGIIISVGMRSKIINF